MLVQQVPIAHHYAHDGVRTDVHSRCLLLQLLPRKNVATFWFGSWDGPFVTHPMRKKCD